MRISVLYSAEVAALAGMGTARPALNGAGTGTAHAQDTTGQAAIVRTRQNVNAVQNADAKRGETDTTQRKAEFESPAIPGPATKSDVPATTSPPGALFRTFRCHLLAKPSWQR